MRDTRLLAIKVGIAVVVAVVVFVLAFSWLTQFSLHKKRYHYRIKFKEVGWINKGDIVTVLGVPKGRVEGIELYPDSVMVKIWIEDYPLREGAKAWIESAGFIGQMRLGVSLGHGPPLKENSIIEGTTKKSISELVSDMGAFLARSDTFLRKAVELLTETSKNIGDVSGSLLTEIHLLVQNLNSTIDSLKGSTQGMKENLSTALVSIKNTAQKLDSIATVVQTGKGTLGKITKEEDLYYEMDSTIRELRSLIKDIRDHPERYLSVKFELF